MRTPEALAEDVKAAALALGFDLVGISAAESSDGTRALRPWLERGFGGEMHYLARRVDEREDPKRVLDGARSVVAVALDYDTPSYDTRGESTSADGRDIAAERETDPETPAPSTGKVARYARGDDYHDVMLDRVRALGQALEGIVQGPVGWRGYVDTGPVQERVFAALGGLGWLGKNTCLIHPELGSFLFLGVLLTDAVLAPDGGPLADQCGTCTACLDACPTDAFVESGVLDATRCIAYTTIETKEPVSEALRGAHGDHVFGCDVCQDVCPWNTRRGRSRPADELGLKVRLAAREQWVDPPLAALLELDDETFRAETVRSPVRRAGRIGLLRSALLAAGNSGDVSLLDRVARLQASEDAAVAEHARWAHDRLVAGADAGIDID